MTQKHINARMLNSIPRSIKDWMKTHTISDAKLLLQELSELGEDITELEPLIFQLEEMEEEAREYLGLGEEDIVEFSEPESLKAEA